ncbi:hypothetical protein ACM64Y_03595 [Novispirillum sp. DQ9]|uniref:hypothetical protein n=1 Tax=Novispirillum sp. DQ9 TaxID=3398612 RepID=UPI003C7A8632
MSLLISSRSAPKSERHRIRLHLADIWHYRTYQWDVTDGLTRHGLFGAKKVNILVPSTPIIFTVDNDVLDNVLWIACPQDIASDLSGDNIKEFAAAQPHGSAYACLAKFLNASGFTPPVCAKLKAEH